MRYTLVEELVGVAMVYKNLKPSRAETFMEHSLHKIAHIGNRNFMLKRGGGNEGSLGTNPDQMKVCRRRKSVVYLVLVVLILIVLILIIQLQVAISIYTRQNSHPGTLTLVSTCILDTRALTAETLHS